MKNFTADDLLQQALQLKPDQRIHLMDALARSLDEPDPEIERVWAQEATDRLQAYQEGRLPGIPMDEVFAR